MPRLPNTAIPSAPPSSAAVSEMPEATPARSGGALPTISSVVRVMTGAMAREFRTEDTIRMASPDSVLVRVMASKLAAAVPSPTASTSAGRTR